MTFRIAMYLSVTLTLIIFAGRTAEDLNANASSSAAAASCPGDFDGNGKVNLADFLAFAGAFGAREGDANFNVLMDIDGNGAVDLSDFLAFAGVFGTTCEDRPDGSVSGDRAALVALYNATDGPNWVNNDNWLTDAPLGEWYGVTTDTSGRVVRLVLRGGFDDKSQARVSFGLQGQLPAALGQLANLKALDLTGNGLVGPIPAALGKLSKLRGLYLNRNRLLGVLPPELGALAKLEVLHLRKNLLVGSIPPEFGGLTNLKELHLNYNELTGPIPSALRGLAKLSILDLGWNSLTGPVPAWLSELIGLRGLFLEQNELTGPIPPELGGHGELKWLVLSGNALSGTIPPELANLDRLQWFWAADNNLTGTIPPVLGNLSNLTYLNLARNNLTGSIPPELGSLTRLNTLSLDHNNLTGTVPSELGELRELRSLVLSENRLRGALPRSFLGLDNLETMGCGATEGVCLPATAEFRAWVEHVEGRGNFTYPVDVPFCDEIDKEALEALYSATNGSGWTRSDGWVEDENLDRWHGVRVDSIGRVSGLNLSGNGLSGHLPGALGRLASLKELRIRDNALVGRLPLMLASVPLEELDYAGTSLCVPDDAVVQGWLAGIRSHSGTGAQCPPLTEREILEEFYRSADGPNWVRSAGWLTDAPLAQWQGVETDAAGSVVTLRLQENGLSGLLPVELAQLPELKVLNLEGNDLSGTIPVELGELANLTRLDLAWNEFTGAIPEEFGQLSELRTLRLSSNDLSGAIPAELGRLGHLKSLDLHRNQLSGGIPEELAKLASLTGLELGGNFLTGPIPPRMGDLNRLVYLGLWGNQLSGSIPSSLGKLGAIESIQLAGNGLTGRVPQELGGLIRLARLDLSENQLTGSIPAGIGRLTRLTTLELAGNKLEGSIPAELGDLADLTLLDLGNNALGGPLPPDLGRVANLETMDLRSNGLEGSLPPEFGNLTQLKSLILANNPDLSGPLPPGIAELGGLDRLMAGGTGLCRPPDPAFDAWFRDIPERRLVRCAGGASMYLTQAVQSWDDPVPLLAGEPALFRVFVTAQRERAATMPEIRARFYVDGAVRHTVDIPASAQTIPVEVTEGSLEVSANAEIPDWVITPGLEMAIEVDPEGILDPALGITTRIPASGRMPVDVREVPRFRLTLIPFLWADEPDSTPVEYVAAMAADPDGHELLRDVRALLPVTELAVIAHKPVTTSTRDISDRLSQVSAMRLMEGGTGYWMGIYDWNFSGPSVPATKGVAFLGGQTSMSTRHPPTIAHELGHNLSLKHAPCGSAEDTDPWFPHSGGSIGAWGYDGERNVVITPDAPDVMSYCTSGIYWISDFFFNKALNHRLAEADVELATATPPTRTLLLWGGQDKDGVPYLDPAFVVDAVPVLPPSGAEYTIEGADADADGVPLFSYPFDMPEIGDAEGEASGFVFALPVQPEWAGSLASITLTGPRGSATLDETTDRPMAILRDPVTRQVRGFLSDLPAGATAQAAAKRATVAEPGLEVLFSRGIPDLR